MKNMFTEIMRNYKNKKQARLSVWKIEYSSKGYQLHAPYRFTRLIRHGSVKEPIKEFSQLTLFEERIFFLLIQKLENPHIYFRLRTYYSPLELNSIVDLCQSTQLRINDGRHIVFFINDCNDKRVWKAFLEAGTNWDGGKLIYALNRIAENGNETTERIVSIVDQLIGLHGKYPQEFMTELSNCQLLSYSIDNGFVIAKIDIPKSIVLSIFEQVADEYNLDLKIENVSALSW